MMLMLVVLAAAPVVLVPAEITAPLGHFGNSVGPVPEGGMSETDRYVTVQWEGCEPQAVFFMRFLGGAGRTLEQLQQSLDRTAGSEKQLFASKKNVLTEVLKQTSTSRFEAKAGCTASPVSESGRLSLSAPPKKWCPAAATTGGGELWFFSNGKPAAVVSIAKGSAATPCRPRLSSVLFDAKGAGRVRIHGDWGGQMAAEMLGEKCQVLDYAFDEAKQAFVPTWKSCKP